VKSRGILADEDGDRMFGLCALQRIVGDQRARPFELGTRLIDVSDRGRAAPVEMLGKLE
jgi:hypothetical protein